MDAELGGGERSKARVRKAVKMGSVNANDDVLGRMDASHGVYMRRTFFRLAGADTLV